MKRQKEITCVAIIPARGGSKGIPRKNIMLVGGIPLVGRTIRMALDAKRVNRVYVSTDDKEIAEVSHEFGASVILRPTEISGDFASSESALLHALDHIAQSENLHPKYLAFLQCTAPLLMAEDIDGALEMLIREEVDSVLAAAPFKHFLWRQKESGPASTVGHEIRRRKMRQALAPQYLEAGSVYAMTVMGFRQAQHRFFGTTRLYSVPAERIFEIDEPADIALAEFLVRKHDVGKRKAALPGCVDGIVFDFDGVFTDNHVFVDQNGKETVVCDRSDGLGIEMLRKSGVSVIVLSREKNPVVAARCAKLRISCVTGLDDKVVVLQEWIAKQKIDADSIVYVGNDINDLSCMGVVGCPVAVADAHPEVKAVSRIVLDSFGGKGAVREIIDLILNKREGARI